MVEVSIREGRSLEETPTWSVATVTTVMVFVSLFVERSIYKFSKWLKKTKRKARFASLEKLKEELMLLGLISLLLGQWARWISQICVNSSLFSSKFYICSEQDYDDRKTMLFMENSNSSNGTDIPPRGITYVPSRVCSEGREPFVSQDIQLEEIQAGIVAAANAQAKDKVMRRQSTFALHHASHPWSRSRILIWKLCFLKQFRNSVQKPDYMALRLGFITVGIRSSYTPYMFGFLANYSLRVLQDGLLALSLKRDKVQNLVTMKMQNQKLPLSYNFHKYMVRSMEDEFYGIRINMNGLKDLFIGPT
ncbi:hypothetical protein OROHE_024923 [Orobanche hederae]